MTNTTKLRELLAKATPGTLILATSNSWRRIVTLVRSTPVCVPYTQHDGHPDLHFPNGGPDGPDATLLLEARNALPALLDEIDRLRAALKVAEAQIQADREALPLCHGLDGEIPADDTAGLEGLAEYDEVLNTIAVALGNGNGDAP